MEERHESLPHLTMPDGELDVDLLEHDEKLPQTF